MKKFSLFFSLIISICILTACSYSEPQIKQYDDRELNIGILGEQPKIRYDQINFTRIQFSDLEKSDLSTVYDAVFIVQDSMPEGTQTKYINYCKYSKIPFFFIGVERLGNDQTYATGFMYKDNKSISWTYGFPENVVNDKNIKDVYTKIFQDIYKNTLPHKRD